jgi:hypothetical protein
MPGAAPCASLTPDHFRKGVNHGYRAFIDAARGGATPHSRLSGGMPERCGLVLRSSPWLAVLFVGVFGGNFVHNSATEFTSFPVVVFLLPFVLPATIVVGRHGFTRDSHAQDREPQEDTQTQERAAAEPPALRAKPA